MVRDRTFIERALRAGNKLFLIRDMDREWGCVEREGRSVRIDPALIKSLWSDGALLMTGVTNGRRGQIYELVIPAWCAK